MTIKNLALIGGALLLAGCPSDGDTSPPATTGDTDTVPTPAFVWNVTMNDADGVADSGFDADTTVTETQNSVANFANIVEFEFGLAQTELGPGVGWFGEDCDGIPTAGTEICHLMAPDTEMTLTRVETIPEIIPGSTTLNNVDFPVSGTPGVSFVLFGYDNATPAAVVDCWAQGHNPAYWGACDVYEPAM